MRRVDLETLEPESVSSPVLVNQFSFIYGIQFNSYQRFNPLDAVVHRLIGQCGTADQYYVAAASLPPVDHGSGAGSQLHEFHAGKPTHLRDTADGTDMPDCCWGWHQISERYDIAGWFWPRRLCLTGGAYLQRDEVSAADSLPEPGDMTTKPAVDLDAARAPCLELDLHMGHSIADPDRVQRWSA